MRKELELVLLPQQAANNEEIKLVVAKKLHLKPSSIQYINHLRRSIDARSRIVKVRLKVEVFVNEKPAETQKKYLWKDVSSSKEVIVVGAGPAGLFAALGLIERGLKPIILERGKKIGDRKKDIAQLYKTHQVNTESNYCFGEGGAGTYSDGKLYTRSSKRGNVKKILEIFVDHGADPDILVDAHPHLGTNKLLGLVTSLRNTILEAGGEVHFETKVNDFMLHDQKIIGVVDANGKEYRGIATILASGHSARDIYYLLNDKGILIERKDFAAGVRIEHPQKIINSIQYHTSEIDPLLPTASYSLVTQVEKKGIFSFCMCPGGIIVPSATASDEVVVNGMSNAMRNSPYANSGIVVTINQDELTKYHKHGVFAGLEFQRDLERMAHVAGGRSQKAPAQRMVDYVAKKMSSDLPSTSYIPGISNAPMHELLPSEINEPLRKAFGDFGKKMKGYYTEEAIILGVESRTSSPIRIPRDKESMEHVQISNLYPCGEGAGYAGGIVSSAMDGENAAEKIAQKL
ncbi:MULTISPECIES: NAD(P)/FAD-dependent oxidoreductase [unclassified Lentimicrobium]|uniref:NAD(P)/FAD-dependent oxidoreductase n=1 Tax=unclassified Lentimicrobium TaxID=2677434 RepID=UPI001556F927|nr:MULTISPECIES: NAD(P)/FAD-dependent oxidoreductase [unclassified Lentimicrobium]NPD46159.1 FAD-binding protein [Lentimicrobium sp. S6]NPD83210.1 FAD-binding protein [Lentimicrobium sp. L6]